MKIRFLRDFQSKHTGEIFYAEGSTADFDGEAARALVDEGAAEMVPLVAREGQAKPADTALPFEVKDAPSRATPRRKRGR